LIADKDALSRIAADGKQPQEVISAAQARIYGAKSFSEFRHAAERGNLREVKQIVRYHPEYVKAKDTSDGQSCLHFSIPNTMWVAADRQYSDLIRFLLDSGADIKAKDREGATPLHNASALRGWELSDSESVTITSMNNNGRWSSESVSKSPIVMMTKIRTMLIEAGAPINEQNNAGFTPATVALLNATPEGALLLLQKGADPTIPTKHGETCMTFVNSYYSALDKLPGPSEKKASILADLEAIKKLVVAWNPKQ
jgi:ankyrin repeat protein